MNHMLENERELYFERGGPSYRLMQRIGLIHGDNPSVRRRIIGFLALTWIPLFVLCLWEGGAVGATPEGIIPVGLRRLRQILHRSATADRR